MHQFDFGWGPPQTPLGELTALPDPLAGFKGPTSKGRGGERREGKEGKRSERKGREETIPLPYKCKPL